MQDDLDGGKTKVRSGDALDGGATKVIGDKEGDVLSVGSLFAGRYKILSEGQPGGMGVVYKCKDERLNESTALKVIHPRLLRSPEAVKRFNQEVSISRKLSHEGIVRVHDIGSHGGLEYFTMEWVEGESLRNLINERKQAGKPFTLAEAYEIIHPLTEALHHAHRYTIHRDIKPENILISRDKAIRIKLTDFGIAKMLSPSQFISTNIQMGTPYYMAPEQKADTGHVDHRADIYSLGVVLFELLTLENTVGPELPSDLNPDLPKEIDAVFRKAVALRPENRYGSVRESAEALRGVVENEERRREEERKEADRLRREAELEAAKRKREEEEKARREVERAERERIEREEAEEKKKSAEEERKRQEKERKRIEDEQKRRDEEERRRREHEESERKKREEDEKQRDEARERRVQKTRIKVGITLLAVIVIGAFMYGVFQKSDEQLSPKTPAVASAPASSLVPVPAPSASSKAADKMTNTLGMKFVLIPAGTFTMGSPSSEPDRSSDETQHRVTISSPFYLQATEVTQGQWRRVMGSNPSHFKNCGDDCPVEQVSWNDVQDFIRKLNSMEGTDKYRLPTEAEWEYAARAGTTTRFHTGDSDGDLSRAGWYGDNSGGRTHPVGQKEPNAWGLYDMHGNVWEWCQDWYGGYPSGSVTDPTGPSSGSYRVDRGGSRSRRAGFCRSAVRYNDTPDFRGSYVGFRLLRTY